MTSLSSFLVFLEPKSFCRKAIRVRVELKRKRGFEWNLLLEKISSHIFQFFLRVTRIQLSITSLEKDWSEKDLNIAERCLSLSFLLYLLLASFYDLLSSISKPLRYYFTIIVSLSPLYFLFNFILLSFLFPVLLTLSFLYLITFFF